MGVCVVEADASDCSSYDEDCSSCWGSSSSAKTTKTITKSSAKINNNYYYDSDKTETLHQNVTGKGDARGGSSGGPSKSSKQSDCTHQPNYRGCAKDLIGNCKEFRIEQNRQDLRIIGNGSRVRISQNSGNLQIIGNNTRLKILSNSGNIKYTGNDGRIYLGSGSEQQAVDYIGCNGILKIVKPTELQSSTKHRSKKPHKNAEIIATDVTKNHQQHEQHQTNVNARSKPKFKSASFGGSGSGIGAATSNWQQFEKRFQSQKETHVNSSSGCDSAVNNSLPNLNLSINCSQFGNKEKNLEIKNKLTVVNNVGGNVVINNAINVSI